MSIVSITHLQIGSGHAALPNFVTEGHHGWIDGPGDGAGEAVDNECVGDSSDDADGRLWPDLLKSRLEWSHAEIIDDLGLLHDLARCDI